MNSAEVFGAIVIALTVFLVVDRLLIRDGKLTPMLVAQAVNEVLSAILKAEVILPIPATLEQRLSAIEKSLLLLASNQTPVAPVVPGVEITPNRPPFTVHVVQPAPKVIVAP